MMGGRARWMPMPSGGGVAIDAVVPADDSPSGCMITNEFVPTPASTFGYLRWAGLIGPHGLVAKQGMRRLLPRMQRVVGPVQEVTSADSRVGLDPSVTDRLGIPVRIMHDWVGSGRGYLQR